MGARISKKVYFDGANESLYQKISKVDIEDYIKMQTKDKDIKFKVDDDLVTFEKMTGDGLIEIISYPWEQFVEKLTLGEEINFDLLNKTLKRIVL